MSGQIRFFHPFRNSSSSLHHDNTGDSNTATTKNPNATHNVEDIIPPYSESYQLDHPTVNHDNPTFTRRTTKEPKEETKTLLEWKRTYKRILMKYLARRISESDGSILDDSSNNGHGRFPLKTRVEIMYYACKFGFFPLESFRNIEEEETTFRKDDGNLSCLLGSKSSSASSHEGDRKDTTTASINILDSDILETQAFHLEQTARGNVSPSVSGHPAGLQLPREYHHDETSHNRHNMQQQYESSFVVPCIHDLQSFAKSVSDIHLLVSKLSIALASVVNVWKFQRFEHRDIFSSNPSPQQDTEQYARPFPREWFDNHGPMFANYTSVVSFEIMECEEEVLGGRDLEQVRNLSKAVFGQKTRRIRVFFYNTYAEAVSNIIMWAEQCIRNKSPMKKTMKMAAKDGGSLKDRIMISLKNVPAQCIFPYFRQDYQSHVHGKPLESEYGLLSDYCICIGGDGCIINQISSNRRRPLRFDSEQLEVSFVIKRRGNALDEFVINRETLGKWNEKSKLKVLKRNEEERISHTVDLCKRFFDFMEKKKNSCEESNNIEKDNLVHVANPLSTHATVDKKRKSSVCNHRYTPLSELGEFYLKHANGKRRDREIDICAAVLNVGVPRLTKRNWMMNLTIFDASQQCPVSGVGNETSNIPQVRLVIFSNSVENFPQIDCAGDVIIAQRLLVDKFEGELQLTAFAWSKFTVCRPTAEALALYYAHDGDNEPLHPTNSNDDWLITQQHNSIDIELVHDLWKFSQERMSNHPNVQPKYQITLDQVEHMCSEHKEGDANNCGDLTAMICNVIPYPRTEQSLSSPKGVVRIWDGTGQACCDPLPEGFAVYPEWSKRTEPNEQDMLFLSKVVERTKKEICKGILQEFSDNYQIFDELEAPKCLCGRVSNVIIWETQHWALIQRFRSNSTLEMGRFVRFRNAVIKAETVPTLHVNVNTTITPIPVSTFEIKALLLRHFKRTLLNHPFNPRCGLLPLVLSDRVRGTHSSTESQGFAKDGFSRLIDCISAPPLTPIKVTFRILGTKQDLSKTKCLQDICITNGKLVKYQLVFHVCDAHLDMFLNVPEVVAEKMLGISASDLIKKDKDDASSNRANSRFCQLINSHQIVEGTVMGVYINRKKFFLLTECAALE